MSQIIMTNSERAQGLRRFGYSDREAEFLCLAGLHGGYFLRRQYAAFLEKEDGGAVTQLTEKALAMEHVTVATYAGNTRLYHLATRPFYAALGQEDNRNRRVRQPATIKTKLMGFDFVLAHRQHEYLATEQEKLDYFTATLGLEKTVLPVKRYTSCGKTTERYFVEKFPLFHSPSAHDAAPPVVSFCFVDPGFAGVDAFWTFLQQYGCLFGSLREVRVNYVADAKVQFQAAERAFGRFLSQDLHLGSMVLGEAPVARILEHFEIRKRYEDQEWSAFDRAKLIQFRDDRREFSGEEYEDLYRRWKANGTAAMRAILNGPGVETATRQGTFATCHLEKNYDLFGNLSAV